MSHVSEHGFGPLQPGLQPGLTGGFGPLDRRCEEWEQVAGLQSERSQTDTSCLLWDGAFGPCQGTLIRTFPSRSEGGNRRAPCDASGRSSTGQHSCCATSTDDVASSMLVSPVPASRRRGLRFFPSLQEDPYISRFSRPTPRTAIAVVSDEVPSTQRVFRVSARWVNSRCPALSAVCADAATSCRVGCCPV
jgi:hypothetical protein